MPGVKFCIGGCTKVLNGLGYLVRLRYTPTYGEHRTLRGLNNTVSNLPRQSPIPAPPRST